MRMKQQLEAIKIVSYEIEALMKMCWHEISTALTLIFFLFSSPRKESASIKYE